MTADNLERTLRSLVRRYPFRTFLIELLSDDRVLVSHPEAVSRFGELFLALAGEWMHRGDPRAEALRASVSSTDASKLKRLFHERFVANAWAISRSTLSTGRP